MLQRTPLRARDRRRFPPGELRRRQLRRIVGRRNIHIVRTRSKQGNMSNTRKFTPLSSAVAGGTVVRVDNGFAQWGGAGMAHRTASFPIYRGVLR